jgi:hypothetical protein
MKYQIINKTADTHLNWCKERSYAYLNNGDYKTALASFTSDIRKSPTTAEIGTNPMFGMMLFSITDCDSAFSFIDGWN